MSLQRLVLIVSVILNALLLSWVLLLRSTGTTGVKIVQQDSATFVRDSVAANETSSSKTNDWSRFHEDGPKGLAAKLRAAGFPPRAVRIIVGVHVNEIFAARRREIVAAAQPFWKPHPNGGFDAKTTTALRSLAQEQGKMTQELLSGEKFVPEEIRELQRLRFGNLSDDTHDRVQGLVDDYAELRARGASLSDGLVMPQDPAKIAILEREFRSDLAKLLTPHELEEYEMRSGNTATRLRARLAAFDVTETEFRALHALEREFEGRNDSSSENALNARIRATLGDQRFVEYQRSTHPDYLAAHRVVTHLDLPISTVTDMVKVKEDVFRRAATLRTSSLPQPVRDAQLLSLVREAEGRLAIQLGDRGLALYKLNGGGWINALGPAGRSAGMSNLPRPIPKK